MNDQIGFLGLGSLGTPMAENLIDGGYGVTVYNRTPSKAESLVAKGAKLAQIPADAVVTGGVVVNVLWDTDVVEEVIRSDGFLEKLGKNGVHISMCTGSPEKAKHLAELHRKHGSTYVEAPIFGRPEAARAKKLWVPISGPSAEKERVKPIITAMGTQGIFDFGEEIGKATVVKLVGNFLIISAARSMNEAITMADKAGVDKRAVVEMLTTTLFNAPIYQNYGRMIVEGTAPMSGSQIVVKDLGLFTGVASESNSDSPIANFMLEMIKNTN